MNKRTQKELSIKGATFAANGSVFYHRRKLYFLCLIMVLILNMLFTSTLAYAKDKVVFEIVEPNLETAFDIGITGRYFPVNKQEILDYINKERKEAADKGYFGYKPSDYKPLRWNQQLEQLARERAIEASIFPIHSRPNGESISLDTWDENLAWSVTDNTMTNIRLLMSEKTYYLRDRNINEERRMGWGHTSVDMEKIGHYYAFMFPVYSYIGASSFQMDGNTGITPAIQRNPDIPNEDLTKQKNYTATVVTFAVGNRYGTNEEQLPELSTEIKQYSAYVSTASRLRFTGSRVQWPDDTLETGKSYAVNAFAGTYYNDQGIAISAAIGPVLDANWISSDASVLRVKRDGTLEALKPGKATITLAVKWASNLHISKEFTITGNPVSEVTGDPIQPSGPWVNSVDDFKERAVDYAPEWSLSKTSSNVITMMVKMRKNVDTLKYLDIETKEDIKMEIQDRQSIAGDDSLKIAKMESIYNFAKLMNDYLGNIERMSNLSSLEKNSLKNKILDIYRTSSKKEDDFDLLDEKISEIVTEGELMNYMKIEEKALAKVKTMMLERLDAIEGLSAEDKAIYKERLEKGNSQSDLETILEEATAKGEDMSHREPIIEDSSKAGSVETSDDKKTVELESGNTDLTATIEDPDLIIPDISEGYSSPDPKTESIGKFGLLYIPSMLSFNGILNTQNWYAVDAFLQNMDEKHIGVGSVDSNNSGWQLTAKLIGPWTNGKTTLDVVTIQADRKLSMFSPEKGKQVEYFQEIMPKQYNQGQNPQLPMSDTGGQIAKLTINYQDSIVMSAQKGKGYGYWDVSLNHLQLTAFDTKSKYISAGSYQGGILWTLARVPN